MRCVPEDEQIEILEKCHASPYGRHFERDKTTHKILQSGFYWPTLFRTMIDIKNYDRCQRMGNINRKNEMLLQGILVVQIFDV